MPRDEGSGKRRRVWEGTVSVTIGIDNSKVLASSRNNRKRLKHTEQLHGGVVTQKK